MLKKLFVNTEKHGNLYVDRILFESNLPIIFTCVNDNEELFLCVCCQNNQKVSKWVIEKTDKFSITRLLKDEITIRSLLLEFSSDLFSVIYDGKFSIDRFSQEDLPKEDSFMYTEPGEFDDDINYFYNKN